MEVFDPKEPPLKLGSSTIFPMYDSFLTIMLEHSRNHGLQWLPIWASVAPPYRQSARGKNEILRCEAAFGERIATSRGNVFFGGLSGSNLPDQKNQQCADQQGNQDNNLQRIDIQGMALMS